MTRSHPSQWAISGLYLFALVLVFSPMMDLASTVWPARFGELAWRYGFLGLLPGYIHTPILGLIMAGLLAYGQGHTSVVRVLAALSLVGALVLLSAMTAFALDVLQMRGLRPPEEQTAVLVGGVLQEVKYLTACVVLALLGLGGRATAKGMKAAGAGGRSSPGIVPRA